MFCATKWLRYSVGLECQLKEIQAVGPCLIPQQRGLELGRELGWVLRLLFPLLRRLLLLFALRLLLPLGEAAQVDFKTEVEGSISQFSFKRLDAVSFNVGLIGSTCTALPRAAAAA